MMAGVFDVRIAGKLNERSVLLALKTQKRRPH